MLATNSDFTYKWQSRTVYSAPARLLTNNVGKYAMAIKYFRCDYSQFQSEPLENAVCIPLTRGRHAIIDADDYDLIKKWRWHAVIIGTSVYVKRATRDRKRKCINIYIHRMINNTPDGLYTDHIDGNPLDNRKCNLRTCTISQNSMNRDSQNKRCKGVHFKDGRYSSRIGFNGQSIHLGMFDDLESAAAAYREAALKYHGEFARPTNRLATVDEMMGE